MLCYEAGAIIQDEADGVAALFLSVPSPAPREPNGAVKDLSTRIVSIYKANEPGASFFSVEVDVLAPAPPNVPKRGAATIFQLRAVYGDRARKGTY